MDSRIKTARNRFHRSLLDSVLSMGSNGVASISDKGQKTSIQVGARLLEKLNSIRVVEKSKGQTSGNKFEQHVEDFLKETFPYFTMLRPGNWEILQLTNRRSSGIAKFEQFQHLRIIMDAVKGNKALESVLGMGYLITPDVVVIRHPVPDVEINAGSQLVDSTFGTNSPIRQEFNEVPLLHASVSCKWTLRSDRAQNARSEALNLLRNRNGQSPHIVVVTAEPMPTRIASLAQGTGDIDCVYHFALPELVESVREAEIPDSLDLLTNMIRGKRLKDISDLPLDLCR